MLITVGIIVAILAMYSNKIDLKNYKKVPVQEPVTNENFEIQSPKCDDVIITSAHLSY